MTYRNRTWPSGARPDDVLVPRTHAEWLITHAAGAQRHELPGGHAISHDSIAEVLSWVGCAGAS